MTFLILSGATPSAPWHGIGNYTWLHNTAYAEAHGGEAVWLTLEAHTRPASWGKLPAIARYSKRAAVLWVDADCILPHDLDPAALLATTPDQFRTVVDENGINCGVMAFPRAGWVAPFVASWWASATYDEIHHNWWEQATLHRLANAPGVRARLGPPIDAAKLIHAAGIPAGEKLKWLMARMG